MFGWVFSILSLAFISLSIPSVSSNLTYLKTKFRKFKSLVGSYHDRNNSYPSSLYKAMSVVIRTNYLEWVSHLTTIKEPQYSLVKLMHGGSIYLLPILHHHGPKKKLEYAYFGNERHDVVLKMLAGPNRDFNGHPDILLHLAHKVRYKYIGEEEIIVDGKGESEWINEELIKKILSMNKLENLRD